MHRLPLVFIASFAVLLSNCVFAESEDGGLHLHLLAQTGKVSLGDPVQVKVELHAGGESLVWLPAFLEVGVNLEIIITGPDGKPIRHIVKHRDLAPLSRDSFIRLPADHFIGREVFVSSHHFKARGIYMLDVIYDTEDDGSEADVNAWTGTLRSNKVHVSVE